MTLTALYQAYCALLYHQFLWDLGVWSEPWIYEWVLVPALAFFWFFCCKWVVLLFPVWLVLALPSQLLLRFTRRSDKLRKRIISTELPSMLACYQNKISALEKETDSLRAQLKSKGPGSGYQPISDFDPDNTPPRKP